MNYVIAVLFPVIAAWSMNAANAVLPEFNRPRMFWGSFGTTFLMALNLAVIAGSLSGIVWMYKIFPIWIEVSIVVVGFFLGASISNRLQHTVFGSGVGLILGALGLAVLHWVAWSVFPPR